MRGISMFKHRHNRSPNIGKLLQVGGVAVLLLLATACHNDMYDQPRYEPLSTSTFFADGRSSRPPVPNTVAVEQARTDEELYTGQADGQVVDEFPMPVTREMIERGQEQYNINCVPCHGLTGYGDGMVYRRGGIPPANFHTDRLRDAPVGHFFDVITNGYRYMYPYGHKIAAEDRWAIIAYIRALQLSQNATSADVPPGELQNLQGMSQ